LKAHNFKWDYNCCKNEALKYKSRSEFKRNNSSAYTSARLNKWLDKICIHMTKKDFKKKIKWTKEKCKNEALKYNSRSDFQKHSSPSYLTSMRNGWLDEICSHMKPKGSRYKRCIYSYEFINKYVYVGLTYNLNKRHKKRMLDKKDTVLKFIKKTNLNPIKKQLTDYLPIEISINLESEYIDKYKKDGWIILNKVKPGSIGGNIIKWNFKNTKNEALKYKNKTDFRKNNISAYRVALKND
jgi:hypothetical protein